MIAASLPMYDWPEVREATDEFWNGLARHAGVKGGLQRGGDHTAVWRRADMEFSQTCGYPLTHEFKGILTYLATPHYGAEGCDGPLYSSFVFAKSGRPLEGFAGATPAINAMDSMSGMLALKLVFASVAGRRELFAPALITGSHLASLAAVREGKADLCAIDSVCVGLAKKYRPQDLDGLTEVTRSPMVPGLPFVTRGGNVQRWREALKAAFADPALAEARQALLLKDVSLLPPGAYDQIVELEGEAKLAL